MSSIKYLDSNLISQKKYSLNVQFQINSLKVIHFKLNVLKSLFVFLKHTLQMSDRQNKLSQTQVRIFINSFRKLLSMTFGQIYSHSSIDTLVSVIYKNNQESNYYFLWPQAPQKLIMHRL